MKLLRVTGGKEIAEVTKVVINITRKSCFARLKITRTYLYRNQPTGLARVGRISILSAKTSGLFMRGKLATDYTSRGLRMTRNYQFTSYTSRGEHKPRLV